MARFVIQAAAEIGASDVPALIKGHDNRHDESRLIAAESLDKIGAQAPDAVPRLGQLMEKVS